MAAGFSGAAKFRSGSGSRGAGTWVVQSRSPLPLSWIGTRLPQTEEMSQRNVDTQSYYPTQYFERQRFEYHDELKGTPYEVLLGRLGADLVAGRTESAFQPANPQPGAQFVTETRHNLSGPIADYWRRNGGVPVFGYPLSEVFTEVSPTDGKPYQVQYFERNRLEYHPENAGTPNEVLLGLLGVQSYQARYGPLP